MARQAGARAQSRPKSTIEGGQSLFRRVGGVWDARRRHIAGGEKGAEARSRCCSARSQRVGCTHPGAAFSGSMGRMTPPRPASRQQRVCGRAQSDQDEAGDGLRHSHDQRPSFAFQRPPFAFQLRLHGIFCTAETHTLNLLANRSNTVLHIRARVAPVIKMPLSPKFHFFFDNVDLFRKKLVTL